MRTDAKQEKLCGPQTAGAHDTSSSAVNEAPDASATSTARCTGQSSTTPAMTAVSRTVSCAAPPCSAGDALRAQVATRNACASSRVPSSESVYVSPASSGAASCSATAPCASATAKG